MPSRGSSSPFTPRCSTLTLLVRRVSLSVYVATCAGEACTWRRGPERATAAEAVLDGRKHLRQAVVWRPAAAESVVLVGEYVHEGKLLVVGADMAFAELRAYRRLIDATTFGQARRDIRAAEQVNDHLASYVEMLIDEERADPRPGLAELAAKHAGDSLPFDAEEYFGEDWRAWCTDGRRSTLAWLRAHEPELLAAHVRPDNDWGNDYDPLPWIATSDRAAVEAHLTAAGHQVRYVPELGRHYLEPGADWLRHVRGER